MMTTGQRLREIRNKRGKTLEDVAEAIGVTPTSISKYESDRIKNIPQQKLEAISEFLDVSVSYILGLDQKEHENIILSIDEQMLIETYRQLSFLNQETVQILAERLLHVESSNEDDLIQLHL